MSLDTTISKKTSMSEIVKNPGYNSNMKTFQYELRLIVNVEAFEESDAEQALEEEFGPGPDGCIDVKFYDVKKVKVV